MRLKICHLYPDALNLYGDRGNVLCMHKRLFWRGISCETETLKVGEHKDLSGYDLFFMGGGADREQRIAMQQLFEDREDFGRRACESSWGSCRAAGERNLTSTAPEESTKKHKKKSAKKVATATIVRFTIPPN